MKHILYDMGNFLQKKYFLSDQYRFLARDGRWLSLGRGGHNGEHNFIDFSHGTGVCYLCYYRLHP